MSKSLYLTFGPVQEFISQARSTGDVFAGSYLLSYLAGCALKSAVDAGGTLVMPDLSDNALWKALQTGTRPEFPGARVGSIPHVANLECTEENFRTVAESAWTGWQTAWKRIASSVFEFVKGKCDSDDLSYLAEIWERQIDSVWSYTWVWGYPADLARRKTLRTYVPSSEPGEKCTVCGVREALHGSNSFRAGVRSFWKALSEKTDSRGGGSSERLCATCCIKRLLHKISVAERALGWKPPQHFPSTVWLSTLPWKQRLVAKLSDDKTIVNYVRLAADFETKSDLAEFGTIVDRIPKWAHDLLRIQGDTLFVDDRESKPFSKELKTARSELRQLAREVKLSSEPFKHFAVLVMDGDKLGVLLKEHSEYKLMISKALQEFSAQVITKIESPDRGGILIYAGGDDVLAFLPAVTALQAATDVRELYLNSFREHAPRVKNVSISAAIVYSHMNAPLRSVIAHAHERLERAAKEQAGRDAISISLWKRSGIDAQLACNWDSQVLKSIGYIKDALGADDDARFSTGFLYSARPILESFFKVNGEGGSPLLSKDEAHMLLTADYLKCRTRTATLDAAKEACEHVLRATEGVVLNQSSTYIEPLMVAKFLHEAEVSGCIG